MSDMGGVLFAIVVVCSFGSTVNGMPSAYLDPAVSCLQKTDLSFVESCLSCFESRGKGENTLDESGTGHELPVFSDNSIEQFMSSLVIESYGAWEDKTITVKASFPAPAEFAWQVYNRLNSDGKYTRGHYTVGPSRITSLLTFDPTEENYFGLALHLTIQQGLVYIKLDEESLRTPGDMRMHPRVTLIDAPDEIKVSEEGWARFKFSSSISRPAGKMAVDVMRTYLDTSLSPPKVEYEMMYSSYYDRMRKPGSFDNIAVDAGWNAQQFGGIVKIVINIDEYADLETDNNYVDFLNIVKYLPIVSDTVSPDVVMFPSNLPDNETIVFADCIVQDNIYCSAYGNKRPTIRILKDERALPTYEFGEAGVRTEAFYPIDGKARSSVQGAYTCEATSGSKTITRLITVI